MHEILNQCRQKAPERESVHFGNGSHANTARARACDTPSGGDGFRFESHESCNWLVGMARTTEKQFKFNTKTVHIITMIVMMISAITIQCFITIDVHHALLVLVKCPFQFLCFPFLHSTHFWRWYLARLSVMKNFSLFSFVSIAMLGVQPPLTPPSAIPLIASICTLV